MFREVGFSVRWMLALGVLVITLIVLLVTAMFLRQVALVDRAREWVLHTYEVSANIEELSNKIKDATLYQRNYLISDAPEFLEAYKSVTGPPIKSGTATDQPAYRRSFTNNIYQLGALTADNPAQQKNIQNLGRATNELVDYMDKIVALRQQHDPAAMSAAVALQDKQMLDRVRDTIQAMLAEETRLFQERARVDKDSAHRNNVLVLSAIAFFYMIKLFLSWLILRQWRRIKTAEHQNFMRAQQVEVANENLQQANWQLEMLNVQIKKSSEAQLRAVVDNAIDGLITINASGIIESFNPACERIFGYKASEVVGSNIKMLMPEPYHSGHDGYLQHYRDTGKAAIIGTAGREVSAKRKDGSVFPMDLSVSAFWLEGKQHFSGILRDITLRKKAEEELLRYTRQLEYSNQELDDFAYIASHDLKEPLRGLFNHASFLIEDYQDKLDKEGVRRLNRLAQLAQRMERLINDLLYFSRLGRSELAVQTTSPNLIIREIEQMMETLLKESNARIAVPNPMPIMLCDKTRMTEVFRNLITNAVKYNDKPERVVEVGYLHKADAPHGPETNVFYVKDNGIGIAPEFHQEIFRIFKRLNKDIGDEKGTGAGLTFVKKIVERHKGHIWLESAPGVGTTFYFTINQEINHHEESQHQPDAKYSVG